MGVMIVELMNIILPNHRLVLLRVQTVHHPALRNPALPALIVALRNLHTALILLIAPAPTARQAKALTPALLRVH
jgi:hypothetical protein